MNSNTDWTLHPISTHTNTTNRIRSRHTYLNLFVPNTFQLSFAGVNPSSPFHPTYNFIRAFARNCLTNGVDNEFKSIIIIPIVAVVVRGVE